MRLIKVYCVLVSSANEFSNNNCILVLAGGNPNSGVLRVLITKNTYVKKINVIVIDNFVIVIGLTVIACNCNCNS